MSIKLKRLIGILLSAALVLGMMSWMRLTAYAEGSGVSYLDWDKTTESFVEKSCDYYTVITDSENIVNWQDGWYVVPENTTVTINGQTLYSGDVHLILCDGATLKCNKGISCDFSQDCKSNLTIYVQSTGDRTGVLETKSEYNALYGRDGLITINGGIIKSTGNGVGGYTIYADYVNDEKICSITIRGGRVEATSKSSAAAIRVSRGTLVISGGVVKAESSHNAIENESGDIFISGGKVEAISTDYYAAYILDGNITITGGEFLATGVGGLFADGTIRITGGTVTASAGDTEYYFGIRSTEDIEIGDDLTIMAGDAAPGTDVTATFATNHDQKWVHIEKPVEKNASSGEVKAVSGLVYDGNAKALVKVVSVEGGIFMIRLGTDGEWTETIPEATAFDTYTVYYYIKGDESHTDTGSETSPMGSVNVTIKCSYSNEWVAGKWYNKDGTQTYEYIGGWKKDGNDWMYADTSGWYAKSRWQKIEGKWYYFDQKGHMMRDVYQQGIDGKIWYVGKNGTWDGKSSLIGWQHSGKGWWFGLYGEDYLKNTWKMINGYWYYFKADGFAARNEFLKGYWFNDNCTQTDSKVYSWHKTAKGWWYGVTGGWYAKNATYTIDGKAYTFDKNGYMK